MKPLLIALLFVFGPASLAVAETSSSGFQLEVGYKRVVIDHGFAHDTHPDDSFLPGADTPGSAGTTRLGTADYVSFGFRYQQLFTKSLYLNVDLGGLFGQNRDERQNDNDSRPESSGSFVYSNSEWGAYSAFGLSYYLVENLYAGAECQIAGVLVSDGWDRWGKDERQDAEVIFLSSLGPKIGYVLNQSLGLEGTLQFQGGGIGCGVQAIIRF